MPDAYICFLRDDNIFLDTPKPYWKKVLTERILARQKYFIKFLKKSKKFLKNFFKKFGRDLLKTF